MYKVQRALVVAFLLMISFAIHGCNKGAENGSTQNKLHSMLSSLKNYEADVTIIFLKDTQTNVIKMKQMAEVEGKYKLIVDSPDYLKGYTTSFDGTNMTESSPKGQLTAVSKPSEAKNQVLFSTFVKNYLNSETVKEQKETLDGKSVITVEVGIPGSYKYMAREKVWFDENKLRPIKMEIYDTENHITIQIEFNNFKSNTQMNFSV